MTNAGRAFGYNGESPIQGFPLGFLFATCRNRASNASSVKRSPSALNHLTEVVENAATPDPQLLFEEFVTKQDFGAWLQQAGISPPGFWFAVDELQEN